MASGGGSSTSSTSTSLATTKAPQLSSSLALQEGMKTLQQTVARIDTAHIQQMNNLKREKEQLQQEYVEKCAALEMEHARKMSALENERKRLAIEKEDLENDRLQLQEAMVDVDEIVNHQNPITLEVGGEKFRTQVGTLLKYKDSLFPRLIRTLQEHNSPGKSNGPIFIDRDSKHFKFILNFLRQGEEVMRGTVMNSRNVDEYVLNEIVAEVRYYKLPELERLVERHRICLKQPRCPDMSALVREGYLTTSIPPQIQSRENLRPFKYMTGKPDTYFRNMNLSGIVFERVLFQKVSFRGCILTNATFKECTFHGIANFKDADLYNARFEHCQGTGNALGAGSASFVPPLAPT